MEPLEQDAMIRKYDYLVRACAARLGVHNDDDALQCGLIGLWEACRAWDGKRSFAPMARRCITHNIIDCLRAQKQDARLPACPTTRTRRAGWTTRSFGRLHGANAPCDSTAHST